MKKVLIIDTQIMLQNIYEAFLKANFEKLMVHRCSQLYDGVKAIEVYNGFDLYVMDGKVVSGHTREIIDKLPKEKVIVISSEESYVQECQKKGIQAFMKSSTWADAKIALEENKIIFKSILNK